MYDRPILVVDVDLTVVRSDLAWLDWLNEQTGKNLQLDESIENSYGLHEMFDAADLKGIDPFDFWRADDVYDNLSPIEGSVETLTEIHDKGWYIVFASHIKGNHHKSKYNFLKRNFPMDGFLATKEKGFIRADAIIDDRDRFLYQFPSHCKRILYETCYARDYTLSKEDEEKEKIITVSSWYDVLNELQ